MKLEGLENLADFTSFKEDLLKKEGIVSLEVDRRKNVIRVEYDLKRINFEHIEKLLQNVGLSLSRKLSERFKRGLAKFTEQNEMDQLNAPVSSCCEDPKGDSRGCSKCVL
jgi:hypothetical protein